MPVAVSLVSSAQDFEKIAPMDYEAWQTPHNPQLRHFRPVLPRDEAIAYQKAKSVRNWSKHNPKEFYLKAVDTETDEVVGFALWVVNDMVDPYGERTQATWYPEGSVERAFAEKFINGLWAFIGQRVTRPHMGMHHLPVLTTRCAY